MPGVVADPELTLSADERAKVEKLLGNPLLYPQEFKGWYADFFATNVPKLPISQVFGYKLDRLREASSVAAQEATTSTSYVNLTTTGPQLTLLANGFYLFVFGYAGIDGDFASNRGKMSLSYNSSTALDADSASLGDNALGAGNGTCARMVLVQLKRDDNNNTVTAKYRATTGTATFKTRYLYALKVVDADIV